MLPGIHSEFWANLVDIVRPTQKIDRDRQTHTMEKGTELSDLTSHGEGMVLRKETQMYFFKEIDKKPAVRQAILPASHSLVVFAAATATTTTAAAVTPSILSHSQSKERSTCRCCLG